MLINFFGKRGSGKTTAIRGQLNDMIGPVVVLDIMGNFSQIPNSVQCKTPSEGILAVKRYVEAETEPESKIIVVQCSDPDLAVDYLCAALWESYGGTLILDEVDAFSDHKAPCFDQAIRYGRNRNIHIITGCRRPAEISRNITAGANMIFAFQTQEPRDLDYFRSTLFGDHADLLISLPKFSGLYIDYDRDEIGTFRIDESGRLYKLKRLVSDKESLTNQKQEKIPCKSKVSSCPPSSLSQSSASPLASRSSAPSPVSNPPLQTVGDSINDS